MSTRIHSSITPTDMASSAAPGEGSVLSTCEFTRTACCFPSSVPSETRTMMFVRLTYVLYNRLPIMSNLACHVRPDFTVWYMRETRTYDCRFLAGARLRTATSAQDAHARPPRTPSAGPPPVATSTRLQGHVRACQRCGTQYLRRGTSRVQGFVPRIAGEAMSQGRIWENVMLAAAYMCACVLTVQPPAQEELKYDNVSDPCGQNIHKLTYRSELCTRKTGQQPREVLGTAATARDPIVSEGICSSRFGARARWWSTTRMDRVRHCARGDQTRTASPTFSDSANQEFPQTTSSTTYSDSSCSSYSLSTSSPDPSHLWSVVSPSGPLGAARR